jgi:hypothetical protein
MRIMTTTMVLLALACPAAASADGDDPCNVQAQAIVDELSEGPTGELSARERGVALAAAVRGCKAERMRIAEIAVGAAPVPAPQRAAPAGGEPAARTAQADGAATTREPAEKTGFVEGLKRWFEQPVECERIRRANGRIVSQCD